MSIRTKRLKGRTWKSTAQHWYKVAEARAGEIERLEAEVTHAWRKGVRLGQANGNVERRDLQRQVQEARDRVDGLRSQLGIVTRERDEWEANAESVMDTLPRVAVTAEQVEVIATEFRRAYTEAVRNAPSGRTGLTRRDSEKVYEHAVRAAFRAADLLIEGER